MIKVLASNFGATIQDLGRTGFGSIGVPTSGTMDRYSSQLANLLLNNDKNAAVLEITFGGCKLLFETECTICITGADFSAKVDDKSIALNTVQHLKKNAILSFGKRIYGTRTYIAVKKGFQTEIILGSRSLYKGITSENVIRRGMYLPVHSNQLVVNRTFTSVKVNPLHFNSEIIECHKGPEFEFLSETQKKALLSTYFTISSNNNRMGYQLEELIKNDLASMLTSAVLQGTIQLTPSGKLIVLMRDCQVTGGYPRVLQLTENAINRLAQKTTGSNIQFVIKIKK